MDKPHTAYQGEEPFVFISYSHADEPLVYPEIRWLQEQGFNIWYDEGISAASRWRDAIADNIAHCSLFVLYVSRGPSSSEVCREELEYALDQQRQILSIHVEDTELPDGMRLGIGNRQALIRHELEAHDYETKLVEACQKHLGSDVVVQQTRPLPVLRTTHLPARNILLAAVALFVGIFGTAAWFSLKPTAVQSSPASLEFTIEIPALERLDGEHGSISVSRDGNIISYVSRREDGPRLIRRRQLTDRTVSEVLQYKNWIWTLFNSPDGEWIGFYDASEQTIRKVSTTGDTLLLGSDIALQGGFFGANWAVNDSIVYADWAGGLKRISADGGEVEALTSRASETAPLHIHPFVLPGTNILLYAEYSTQTGDSRIMALLLDQKNPEPPVLVLENGLLPKVSGEVLVFERDGAIWGVGFDAESLTVTSKAVRIRNDLLKRPSGGADIPIAYYDLSANGTLIYRPREVRQLAIRPKTLHLVGRDGGETVLQSEPRDYRWTTVSRDGCCVAMTFQNESAQFDIWRYNIERGALLRLTDSPKNARDLHFSPDGNELVFSSGVPPSVFKISARDGGSRVRLTEDSESDAIFPTQWDARTNNILVTMWNGPNADIGILDPDSKSLQRLLASEYRERELRLSPDGKWLAFESDQSGRSEIYLRPYPDIESDLSLISLNGGHSPNWHPDGDELFFVNNNQDLVSVTFNNGITGEPKLVLPRAVSAVSYALMPGGEQFLVMKRVPRDRLPSDRIVVVVNFIEQIKRKIVASAAD